MRHVKFKGNEEPCVQYRVIDPTPRVEWDEVLEKFCEVIEIEALGLVALELLVETDNEENIQAIDLLIEATKILEKKKINPNDQATNNRQPR